jgi:ABC-2 type transport system ATP-binding protein
VVAPAAWKRSGANGGGLSRASPGRLGQALVNQPPLLIADEPTIGLDPSQIVEIRQLIKDLAGAHTVMLSSHILPEVSQLCQRVIIINRGQIVASDTPENLSRQLGQGGADDGGRTG